MVARKILAGAGVIVAGGGVYLAYRCGRASGSREVAATRRVNAELVRRMHTDELTSLPNRQGLLRELARRVMAGERYWLGFIDLDHFKEINDSLGHDAADVILREIAFRLAEVADPPAGFVARLQGDEFVVLLAEMPVDQAAIRAAGICEQTGLPAVLDGHLLFPRASVGLAAATPDEEPGDVVHRAEIAMYRAKRAEVGFAIFDANVDVMPCHRMSALASGCATSPGSTQSGEVAAETSSAGSLTQQSGVQPMAGGTC